MKRLPIQITTRHTPHATSYAPYATRFTHFATRHTYFATPSFLNNRKILSAQRGGPRPAFERYKSIREMSLENKASKANDASSNWWNDCMVTWLLRLALIHWNSWYSRTVTDGPMDCPTNGWIDCLIDARTHRKSKKKITISRISEKRWQHLGPTKQWACRPTSR